jgi:hypothetical protein
MLGQLATHWLTLGDDQMLGWAEFDRSNRSTRVKSFGETGFALVLHQRAIRHYG